MDLTRVRGVKNGKVISDQILDVCVRVKIIRPTAAAMSLMLLEEGTLVTEVDFLFNFFQVFMSIYRILLLMECAKLYMPQLGLLENTQKLAQILLE